jgi:hypothetical protein
MTNAHDAHYPPAKLNCSSRAMAPGAKKAVVSYHEMNHCTKVAGVGCSQNESIGSKEKGHRIDLKVHPGHAAYTIGHTVGNYIPHCYLCNKKRYSVAGLRETCEQSLYGVHSMSSHTHRNGHILSMAV